MVVAVDLSDPASAPAAAASWLARTTAKLAATYALFERKGLTLPQQLRQRARTKLWAGHPDGEVVAHSGEAELERPFRGQEAEAGDAGRVQSAYVGCLLPCIRRPLLASPLCPTLAAPADCLAAPAAISWRPLHLPTSLGMMGHRAAGISLVLVGTKYDAFVSVADAEAQRVVSGALRALAHAHGAHLLFTGGLHPGGGGGAEGGGSSAGACGGQGPPAVAGKILRAQMEEFGRLMGHLLFGAAERKM